MARSTTIEHRLSITKSPEKGSAYLLIWSADKPLERNADGMLTVDLDDLLSGSDASAWTTLSNAKRAAAAKVNRQRLKWQESTDESGDALWLASYTEKISA